MRLAALESVMSRCLGFNMLDVSDEGWTRATLESRWFQRGEELAAHFFEAEDGTLVDRRSVLASR